MPQLTTYIVALCMVLYGLVLVVDLVRRRRVRRLLLEGTGLSAAAVVLHVTTGFPEPSGLRAFGGVESLPAIALMFVCILLGMVAQYVYDLSGSFSWLSFLRPLCVSPIVLLPLLGTLQGVSEVEPIQLISFCVLAFQNGFFWKVVFERVKSQV
jgi:hypothetical protein